MNKQRSHLSNPERRVLTAVVNHPGAVSIDQLATDLGKHHNTVREQLAGLIAGGLVARERATSGTRGRPAWLYRATRSATGTNSEFAGLVTALASQLEQVSPAPQTDAIAAGERWGSSLADADADVHQIVFTVLDELGFDPEQDDGSGAVRLRACPLVDSTVHRATPVCDVHHGIIRGIVRSAGGDPDRVDLIAFHEPSTCLVSFDAPRGVDADLGAGGAAG